MMDVGVWKENRAGRQKHNSAFFKGYRARARVCVCANIVYTRVGVEGGGPAQSAAATNKPQGESGRIQYKYRVANVVHRHPSKFVCTVSHKEQDRAVYS